MCAVKRCLILSGSQSHLARSLQPVAIGAVEEVTNPPKPSMERVARRPRESAGRNVSER
jgi:hypothetical protein